MVYTWAASNGYQGGSFALISGIVSSLSNSTDFTEVQPILQVKNCQVDSESRLRAALANMLLLQFFLVPYKIPTILPSGSDAIASSFAVFSM